MQIQLEKPEGNTIEGYSDNEIQINGQIYHGSLMISSKHLDNEIGFQSIDELCLEKIQAHIEQVQPEIILIGHQQLGKIVDMELTAHLASQCLGLESMSIPAACRTFNILVSEFRNVMAYLLFS